MFFCSNANNVEIYPATYISALNLCDRAQLNCTYGCSNDTDSYFCLCPRGFELGADNNTCEGKSVKHSHSIPRQATARAKHTRTNLMFL